MTDSTGMKMLAEVRLCLQSIIPIQAKRTAKAAETHAGVPGKARQGRSRKKITQPLQLEVSLRGAQRICQVCFDDEKQGQLQYGDGLKTVRMIIPFRQLPNQGFEKFDRSGKLCSADLKLPIQGQILEETAGCGD